MTMIHDFTTRQPDVLACLETLLGSLCAPPTRRTARLVEASTGKKARKLVEEATETALDAVTGNREGLIAESADLLYHLAVLWHDQGISAAEIRGEMARRSAVLGIAEKLPKKGKGKATLKRRPRMLSPGHQPIPRKPGETPPDRTGRACAMMLYRDGACIGPVPLSQSTPGALPSS